MKVIDNLITGSPGGLFPSKKKVLGKFNDLQNKFGFSISPDAYVDRLTVGERQQLEIMRLLWMGAEVLILDEPTTGISAAQKESLFKTVRLLAAQGKAIIFVSHKLEEVEDLCHQIAVFREGKNVGEVKPPYSTDKLVEMMFGKKIIRPEKICEDQHINNFVIENLSIDDPRLQIKNVNFEIRRGEVLGLAGMEGSGQSAVLKALAGIIRPSRGHIWMVQENNHRLDLVGKHYFTFKNSGISFLPAARLEEGLIAGLTLNEHFTLAEKQTGFLIDHNSTTALTQKRIQEFNIKGTPVMKIETLSGGNQQRLELALMRSPLRLLLLEHPTRGLDMESTMEIWSKLKQRCKEGASIVFMSTDLDEILQYSDRILVFFNGKVSRALDALTTTIDQLGQLIGGKGWS